MSLIVWKDARLMPGILCIVLFLYQSAPLSAQGGTVFLRDTKTTLTKDRGYRTNGAVLIEESPEKVVKAMTDVSVMREWLFEGMGNQAAHDNKLCVALNSLEPLPESNDACLVIFSLIIYRNWTISGREMHVGIEKTPEEPAWISHIRYSIPLGGLFIKGGGYDIYIVSMGQGRSLVLYDFNIHLAGIAEWLFNMDLYSRNIEWYINKIILNCVEYLKGV